MPRRKFRRRLNITRGPLPVVQTVKEYDSKNSLRLADPSYVSGDPSLTCHGIITFASERDNARHPVMISPMKKSSVRVESSELLDVACLLLRLQPGLRDRSWDLEEFGQVLSVDA